jgi:hypothetical protein
MVLALSLVLVILVPITAGCLGDEEPEDLSEWFVAMTIEQFNTNGERAVNVTELLFSVRFGGINKDPWLVQESDGFTKGTEDFFPIRIEARYDDGKNPVEDFPVMGSSHVLTGALTFDGDKMKLKLDGDPSLYTIDDSIDRYPHDYERTVVLEGDYGDLKLYFNLNSPK